MSASKPKRKLRITRPRLVKGGKYETQDEFDGSACPDERVGVERLTRRGRLGVHCAQRPCSRSTCHQNLLERDSERLLWILQDGINSPSRREQRHIGRRWHSILRRKRQHGCDPEHQQEWSLHF